MPTHVLTIPVRFKTGLQERSNVNVAIIPPAGLNDIFTLQDASEFTKWMFAYLQDIWWNTAAPPEYQEPVTATVTGPGEVYVSLKDEVESLYVGKATVNTYIIGKQTDAVFGRFPLNYVGACAFTREDDLVALSGTGLLTLQSNTPVLRYPLKYLNYGQAIFEPDARDATGFWVHLKEGCVAEVRLYPRALSPGAGIDCAAGVTQLTGCYASPDGNVFFPPLVDCGTYQYVPDSYGNTVCDYGGA